ncbi:Nucleotidyltransferase domain-containing protein [Sulfidibacter corallicola]|uniref:Nucleotidyltransferase domain-containing protein n=1 Tax=Sulfidibacter corallicola TaxID=2818388 RepID=A0A8A4TXX8_SULCO|nr:nucleotidyltransferase domain-containing protein [Sulfidibacter corallicola]QTD53944.1 nucleotidyltransferase domain-containing protein [Sulfidibacter corallicola]
MDPRLDEALKQEPFPFLFVTISGAHLYGFPSPDSDYDLRGAHLLPTEEVLGLFTAKETLNAIHEREGLEIDLVTHDARKFFTMMLGRNGYVMEQLYSPLILRTSEGHERLKEIGKQCLTRHHARHYLGFSKNQWQMFEREHPKRLKPLLYVFRVLLTGIHLMRTGEIEANLIHLNEQFKIDFLPDLIAQKCETDEQVELQDSEITLYADAYAHYTNMLESAYEESDLPEMPRGKKGLNELLIELRLAS